MHSNKQADSEIHGDQLLNFLVNRLSEEVVLDLSDNAKIDAEDLDFLALRKEQGRSLS